MRLCSQERDCTRVAVAITSLLLLLSITTGCGKSISALNGLARTGSIDESAPVHAELQVQIAASPAKVWALLVNASSWPKWDEHIEKVTASGLLRTGMPFVWTTGGTAIHSQVQLFEPERRLAWTGTALTAKAIHVWQLEPIPQGHTMVTVRESMDGPFLAQLFSSRKLAEADTEWLASLKHAAELQE